jgi:hypothetical protein
MGLLHDSLPAPCHYYSRARPWKGRTGCVICCHLLHAGLHPGASESMAAYEASLDPCLNTPYGIP